MLVLCSWNTSLTLNCPRTQCWDYTKRNTETDTTAQRRTYLWHRLTSVHRLAYLCATENPELGIFQNGKQTNRKLRLEIFMIIFLLRIFVCWKCRHTKYAQIIQVNRSVPYIQVQWYQPLWQLSSHFGDTSVLWHLTASCCTQQTAQVWHGKKQTQPSTTLRDGPVPEGLWEGQLGPARSGRSAFPRVRFQNGDAVFYIWRFMSYCVCFEKVWNLFMDISICSDCTV